MIGAWKDQDLPDSVKSFDSTIHPAIIFSFHFLDKSNVDVTWNGLLFKDQAYEIDKSNNLIYVHVVSKLENVSSLLWIIKYVDENTIKVQGNAKSDTHPDWIKDETWYDTQTLHRYVN